MMPIRLNGACAALVCATAAVTHGASLRAQDSTRASSSSRGTTLAEAIRAALRQNVDVALAEAATDSANAELRIARALPNPTLAGAPNTPYQYVASIPLDVMPQRFLRTRVASLGSSAVDLDRKDVERQTTQAVARAFYDALLADEKRSLAMQRRDAVRRILIADSSRFRAGDIPERDLTRSEIELAHSDAEAARADADVHATRIVLQSLMGVAHPDTAFAAVGTLDYERLDPPGDSLSALAQAKRPDVQAATTRVDQSRAAERAATAQLIPTPSLAYVRQYTAPFESGHFYSLGVSFELPSLNLYGGERQRAAAGAEAARVSQRRTDAQVERDVALALAEFRVQRGVVERYQSGLLDKVAQNVTAVQYAYSRGATSLLEVLDVVQSEQDVRTDYLTALHDYWVSVYDLNAAVGADVFGVAR